MNKTTKSTPNPQNHDEKNKAKGLPFFAFPEIIGKGLILIAVYLQLTAISSITGQNEELNEMNQELVESRLLNMESRIKLHAAASTVNLMMEHKATQLTVMAANSTEFDEVNTELERTIKESIERETLLKQNLDTSLDNSMLRFEKINEAMKNSEKLGSSLDGLMSKEKLRFILLFISGSLFVLLGRVLELVDVKLPIGRKRKKKT